MRYSPHSYFYMFLLVAISRGLISSLKNRAFPREHCKNTRGLKRADIQRSLIDGTSHHGCGGKLRGTVATCSVANTQCER